MNRQAGGKLISPTLLSAIVAGGLAFLHPVIQRRRNQHFSVHIDDAGIRLRFGRLRRFSAAWSELRTVDATPGALRLVTTAGRERRMSLRMITNRVEIAEAVGAAAERMGVGRLTGDGIEADATAVDARAAEPARTHLP